MKKFGLKIADIALVAQNICKPIMFNLENNVRLLTDHVSTRNGVSYASLSTCSVTRK